MNRLILLLVLVLVLLSLIIAEVCNHDSLFVSKGNKSTFKSIPKGCDVINLRVNSKNKNKVINDRDLMLMMKDTNFYLCCLHFCKATFFSDNEKLTTQRFLEKCKHLYIT